MRKENDMMRLFVKGINEKEFASRWEAGKEKMYRFAYCYVKNEHDAMEILSEATYRAYISRDKLKEPDKFDSWMGQIIIRTAINYIKKQKKVVPIESYEQINMGGSIDEFEQMETRLDVFTALECITPEEKTYIILKYFEQKSFTEIAGIMDVPEATAKTKVYRSLEKIKQYWKKSEGQI